MNDVTQTATLPEQFREGLRAGELRIQECGNCGRPNMYPRYHCPFCLSDDLHWITAAGTGLLHSFTVVRLVPPRGFEHEMPYGLAVVKLDEGVQLLGRLDPSADGDWAAYACDARVRFVSHLPDDPAAIPIAWFTLEDTA